MSSLASSPDITSEDDAASASTARQRRYAVMLSGTITLQASRREGMPIRVRDVSANGLMGECGYPTRMGDRVAIDLPRIGRITGRVRWGAMGRIGVEFDEPIDPTMTFTAPRRSGLVGAH